MGFIDCASGDSIWRGYDYFQKKKVLTCKHEDGTVYTGSVSGSEGAVYQVKIDACHPRKSTCSCPHAKGTRVVCKHKVALFFTVFPNEAENLLREAEKYEEEEEQRMEQHLLDVRNYVMSLTKAELQEELYDALIKLEDRDYRRW